MSAGHIMKRVEQIYEGRLKSELERINPDAFVAIEPDSGEFFLGSTLSEAAALPRVRLSRTGERVCYVSAIPLRCTSGPTSDDRDRG